MSCSSSIVQHTAPGSALCKLKLKVSMNGMHVNIDWFRMLKQNEVANDQWHHHSGIECHMMLEGINEFFFPDASYLLHAGEMVLIPAFLRHRLTNQTGGLYQRYVLNATISEGETAAERFLHDGLQIREPVIMRCPESIVRTLQECHMEAQNAAAGYEMMIKLAIVKMLFIIARELTDYPVDIQAENIKHTHEEIIALQLRDYIQQNLQTTNTVASLAKEMYMSEKYIQRVIQKKFKCTAKALIVSLRLQAAKEYLKDETLRIGDVAELLGFTTEQSFCRFFKAAEGNTPYRFRMGYLGEG